MESLYIIDASGFLYRSYFAIRNMTNARGESTNALFGFIRSVMKLIKDFHPSYLVAVFDGPNNGIGRQKLYPDYKAHRSSMPPDLRYQIDWARQFCELIGIPFLNIPNVEADDTMGSIAVWAAEKGTKVYLCTSDKDMNQLVSDYISILNTHKDNLIMGPKEVEENYGVTPKQMIDYLAIIGDTSDNIPGLSGFGPKTAEAVLKQYGTLENLLGSSADFTGKKQQTLLEEAEQVRLSKVLVTVDTSVPFPQEVSFFHWRPPQLTPLKEFYKSMSFNSLLRELETIDFLPKDAKQVKKESVEEDLDYQLVDDENAWNHLVKSLHAQKEICFNVVCTEQGPFRSDLVGIGFCIEPKKAWYIPVNGKLGQERVLATLKPLFSDKKLSFFSHNVKSNLHVLARYGIQIENVSFDTILASYLLNAHQRQHSLDYLILEYFGKVKTNLQSLVGKGKKSLALTEVPLENVSAYCCEDADYTFRLKQLLESQLEERKLTKLLYEIELPLTHVLAKMEEKGIFVDLPYLQKLSIEVMKQIKKLEEEIYEMAGERFNLNSPKQLSEILFTKMEIRAPKKTATGLSTSAEVLESLQLNYPIAGKLLQYRTLEKMRSTYIDSLPEEILPNSNRIHCTFNQSVAATGRLSSQDPNLQNIPIRGEWGKEIRKAFRPEKKDWCYLAADYSQIELRLLAHLSEDPTMVAAFRNNEDIHKHTASSMLGIPLEEVTPLQRFQAKAVNFGIIYGQQAFGLSQELGIEVKEAGKFIEMYFTRYPKVKNFVEECKAQARLTGKTVTLTGRERAIPEILSKNGMLRLAAERLAINTPLQGSAADLIKIAMLEVDQALTQKSLKGYMILQIHDELVFELPNEEKEEFERKVRQVMEGVWKLKVPLVVNITIGKNWSEC